MSTQKKSPASGAQVRTAIGILVGAGCFPPWQSPGSTISAASVEVLWVQYCTSRGVTGEDLIAAVARHVSEPLRVGQTRRAWPAPGDILGARRDVSDVAPAGCGSCTTEGLREMAYRAVVRQRGPDRVWRDVTDLRIVLVHCDCSLGVWWTQRGGKPLSPGGEARRTPPTMRDYIAHLRRGDPAIPVYQAHGATFSPAERVRMDGRRCPPVVHRDRPNGWAGVTLRTGQDVPRVAAALVGEGDAHAGARQLALTRESEREQWTGEYGEGA